VEERREGKEGKIKTKGQKIEVEDKERK